MADPEKGPNARPSNFFFQESPKSVPEPISKVFQDYSGIPQDQQVAHIVKVRNGAYKTHNYPCLGRFRFLQLDLSSHPLYRPYLLPRLLNAGKEQDQDLIFLDLGCCLAQDLRKLIFDGVDVKYLYGSDIEQDFIDAGYELFRDEHKLPRDHFICPANVFDHAEGNKLAVLDGRVDVLHITAVFHLFDQSKQDAVALRCMRLMKKNEGSKSLILGAQVGNVDASDFVTPKGGKRFRHNEKSWRALWESICEREEFKGKVKNLKLEIQMKEAYKPDTPDKPKENVGTPEEGFRWLVFAVWLEF